MVAIQPHPVVCGASKAPRVIAQNRQGPLCSRSLSLAHYFSIDLFAEDYGCVSDSPFRLDNKPFELLVDRSAKTLSEKLQNLYM